jgi:hypothetical protein
VVIKVCVDLLGFYPSTLDVSRGLDGVGIGGICLDCDLVSTGATNLFDDRSGCVRALGVSNRHPRSVYGHALGNRGTNATRTARDQRDVARQFLSVVTAHLFWSFFD